MKPNAADTVNHWKTYVSLPIDQKNESLQGIQSTQAEGSAHILMVLKQMRIQINTLISLV